MKQTASVVIYRQGAKITRGALPVLRMNFSFSSRFFEKISDVQYSFRGSVIEYGNYIPVQVRPGPLSPPLYNLIGMMTQL
jgi:hypothetical protein